MTKAFVRNHYTRTQELMDRYSPKQKPWWLVELIVKRVENTYRPLKPKPITGFITITDVPTIPYDVGVVDYPLHPDWTVQAQEGS